MLFLPVQHTRVTTYTTLAPCWDRQHHRVFGPPWTSPGWWCIGDHNLPRGMCSTELSCENPRAASAPVSSSTALHIMHTAQGQHCARCACCVAEACSILSHNRCTASDGRLHWWNRFSSASVSFSSVTCLSPSHRLPLQPAGWAPVEAGCPQQAPAELVRQPQADTTCRQRGAAPVDGAPGGPNGSAEAINADASAMVAVGYPVCMPIRPVNARSAVHAQFAARSALQACMTNYAKFVDSKFIVCTAIGPAHSVAPCERTCDQLSTDACR
jgi:hypothetical protein